MFNTILVPTDGSDHAAKAVEVASNLAVKCDARLILLYAIAGANVPEALSRYAGIENVDSRVTPQRSAQPETLYGSVPVTGAMPKERDHGPIMHDIADRILGQAESIARSQGVNSVDVVTEHGDPAESILESARREEADAIIMGSRGLGNVRALFGSVSNKVSHDARCTCITVTTNQN